ncbi:hypothetical protein [Pseudoalteromonas sp. C12FD-1]|uniref:hypothetical protein n=1 Tax=Pseudoalteromonas sp. C12FD-1 TaxID=3131979 RepID=UPI00307D6839
MSLLTMGCSSTSQMPVQRLSASEIQQAMSYTSYTKRQAAVKALMPDATHHERIALLTLLGEDCLAQAPQSILDSAQSIHPERQACIETGAQLKAQLDRAPINNRPDSALVLTHLIDTQLSGLSQSAVDGLDAAQVNKLNLLCGNAKRTAGGSGLQGSFNRSIRKACQAHVVGNIDKAIINFARGQDRSISLCHDDLGCNAKLPSTKDKPRQAAWTTFKVKLFDTMGISLTQVDLPE